MHIVDVLIIVVFLSALLHIGFNSSKKIKTFDAYSIGNRKFSDFAICCTIAATAIGGTTTMGGVGKSYEIGITQFLAQIGMPISFIIVGTFLAKRFGNYYGCCSLGDIFYKAYGKIGKVLAGITGCVYEIFGTGLQFIAMGTAINILTGLSYITSLFISAGIILIYTGRGGIRAVTFTDVLQFIVLIVAIPILLITVLGKIGGTHALITQLPPSHISITGENFRRYLFLMIPLMLPTLSPIHVQRLLMTSNRTQGVKAYYNLCWIYLFVAIMTIFLGLSAKVIFPNLQRVDQALFMLITNCLPVGIFGIAVIGILAVLMSTADSFLNSGSIMLVNDVIIPFVKRDLSEATKLKMARIASLFIGIAAIIFASQRTGLFETKIIVRTVWLSIILSPLYFLLFNMKISVKGLLISITTGLTTFLLWNSNIKPITKIDGLFPGFFANVITVLFFYFLGGRQKVFTKEELEKLQQKDKRQIKKRPTIREFQLKNNIFLGLCLVFLQIIPLIFETTTLTYSKLLLTLINSIMAILLIFGGSLEIFAKANRFKWLKLVTLFFCLPITSVYLIFTSNENGLGILTLLMSFIVILLGVEKKEETKVIAFCSLLGFITLIAFFKTNCKFYWPENFDGQHVFYIFGYFALLFFLRSNLNTLRQEKKLAIYLERYNLARSLSHDITTPLMVLRLLLSDKKPTQLNEKECQLITNTLHEMAECLEDFIPGRLKRYEELELKCINQCITSCIEKNKILHKNIEIRINATENVFARMDGPLMRRVLNNLVGICMNALPRESDVIILTIGKDDLGNKQILFQNDLGNFSQKRLYKVIANINEMSDELRFGIGFPELQTIFQNWHGKLEIVADDDDKAHIQILLPNEENSNLIK